jgi:hypothetical protein
MLRCNIFVLSIFSLLIASHFTVVESKENAPLQVEKLATENIYFCNVTIDMNMNTFNLMNKKQKDVYKEQEATHIFNVNSNFSNNSITRIIKYGKMIVKKNIYINGILIKSIVILEYPNEKYTSINDCKCKSNRYAYSREGAFSNNNVLDNILNLPIVYSKMYYLIFLLVA